MSDTFGHLGLEVLTAVIMKRIGREADHSSPPSVQVKNGGAIPPLPLMTS
jgi:hypothetical protein